MSATYRRSWSHLAIFAVVGVAACSTSTNPTPATSSTSASPTSVAPKPPPAPPLGKDEVEGLIRSVSGTTITLEQRDRAGATVDYTPQTMITQLTAAQLTDVTAGSCVDVQTVPTGGAVTAHSVTIDPPIDGGCAPAAPPAGAPAESPDVAGKVTSVTGNTVAITSTDPAGKSTDTKVTVTDATSYTKHAVVKPDVIQDGKCMAARGTEADGVLHATTIDLEPCPPLGSPHRHHFYIPGIPIPRVPEIPHIPAIPHIPEVPHIP